MLGTGAFEANWFQMKYVITSPLGDWVSQPTGATVSTQEDALTSLTI